MPPLDNPRHETFARGLARGLSLREASNAAKFFGSLTRIRKRSIRPAIAVRVAELTDQAQWGGDLQLKAIFEHLVALAKEAGDLKSAAAMVAARGLFAEATRLRTGAREARPAETEAPLPPRFDKEEWLAIWGPKA